MSKAAPYSDLKIILNYKISQITKFQKIKSSRTLKNKK